MKKRDPHAKDNLTVCEICGYPIAVDDYGNGSPCPRYGWRQGNGNAELEREFAISYPMLVPVSRAREQYQQGRPFKATFEDFIAGLKFYIEMLFEYHGVTYEVFFQE